MLTGLAMVTFQKRLQAKQLGLPSQEPIPEMAQLLEKFSKPHPPPPARISLPRAKQTQQPSLVVSSHAATTTDHGNALSPFRPMYSAVWTKPDKGTKMETVIILMPTGKYNKEKFVIKKDNGRSFLVFSLKVQGAFVKPSVLWKKELGQRIAGGTDTSKMDEEFQKETVYAIVKSTALLESANQLRGDEEHMAMMFEYPLSIDAKMEIQNVEFRVGQTGINEGMRMAIVDIEADEEPNFMAKKPKTTDF